MNTAVAPSISAASSEKVVPLHPLFAAEVTGLDLCNLRTFPRVSELMAHYGVCVFRGNQLSNAEHIAFSRMFGPLLVAPILGRGKSAPRFPEHPELIDVSNLDEHGQILPDSDLRRAFSRANALWHTDASFYAQRGTFSVLQAHQISAGCGNTELVDMRGAYDRLSAKKKALLEDLVLEHSIWYSRVLGGYPEPTPEELASRPPARHRLVQTHAGSGRKTLYLASHASHVVGWPVDEGRQLIAELIEDATKPEYVYAHQWRERDILVWDNLCTMHRAVAGTSEGAKLPRDLRRVTSRQALAERP